MKKLFFGVLFSAVLSLQGLNANVEEFDDCESQAFDYAMQVYDETGDGFKAGQAFNGMLFVCEYGSTYLNIY